MSKRFLILSLSILLASCAIKQTITNQYKLSSFSGESKSKSLSHTSILIYPPEAVAGYETNQMLYMDKPFEITAFAHNAWLSPPAHMLLPLLAESIQRSNYFYAVASMSNSEETDYRLDTQLIELHQNFLVKPSQIDFTAKVVLTQQKNSRVIASKLISYHIPCPTDTPYGGVIAANQAVQQFTAAVSSFIVEQVKIDQQGT